MYADLRLPYKLIILVGCSMLLPFPFGLAALLIQNIVFVWRYRSLLTIAWEGIHRWITIALLLALVLAVIHQNSYGIAAALLIVPIYLFFIFYREFINPALFERLMNLLLAGSLPCALYAWLQYEQLIGGVNYQLLAPFFVVWNDGRADSMFFNPNYYSLIVSYFMLLALYKLAKTRSYRGGIVYSVVFVANMFGLIATQTRIAIPASLCAIIVFGMLLPKSRLKTALILIAIGSTGFFLINYDLLPRFDLLDHSLAIRLDVWHTALQHLQRSPIFGNGLLTYSQIHTLYNGYPTEHAHMIVLDILLNFGFIGSLIFLPIVRYFATSLRQFNACFSGERQPLRALIFSLIVLIMVHGLIDVAIMWIQTSTIFLLVFIACLKFSDDHESAQLFDQ